LPVVLQGLERNLQIEVGVAKKEKEFFAHF
jgi:hypothetical protein